MPEHPPELSLSPRLDGVVMACQRACIATCCGIDAFDFSPLYIAAYLSAFSGSIADDEVATLEREIDSLVSGVSTLTPDAQGSVCSIRGMNQYFSRDEIGKLADQLKREIRQSREVLEYAERIRRADG